MALVSAENVAVQARGFGSLPAIRQLGLMLGLALSVALGVNIAIWSQTPNYSLLYANLNPKDMSTITQTLDSAGIEYQLEGSSLMVAADKVHESRMKLATQGITPGDGVGYELLDKDQGFGSSSFLQKARYQRALEGELAQTISKLNVVESARVHLAIPKSSVFARQSAKPAVSVILNLYPGRTLDDTQVAGIINMVASSVPELEAEKVTVIDQKGRLLTAGNDQGDMHLTGTQFDYTRRVEERYVKRVIDIISPITGIEGVRAQVVADIDFTAEEQTRESYLPEQQVVRSEQTFEERSDLSTAAIGIPGALSNTPPPAGTTNPAGVGEETANTSGNSTKRAVRNYELDRTISHTRQSPVSLKRLSVAVIVNYRTTPGKKGKVERTALDDTEIAYITALVKEAVGLNEARGDTINVVNTPFQLPEEIEPLPEPPIWEQPWVLSMAKQSLGGIAVLLIAFGVLRPMLRNLASHGKQIDDLKQAQLSLSNDNQQANDRLSLTNQSGGSEQQLMDMARSMAKDNPQRVAQVMNDWVTSDG